MAEPYQGNKQLFYNNTYWTTDFVGLGAYKIGDWVSGSYIEALAFDQYFLGRPKIDRVIIRYFSDVKSLVASLLAGDTDVAGVASVGIVEGATLREQWQGGDILPALTSFRVGATQFRDPSLPWVRDLRVRQAIHHMSDRQALVDSLTYGLSMVADTSIAPDDPAYRMLEERGFNRYPYDLTRAERLLNDAGWFRGADGVYQSGGEPLAITIGSPARQDINVQEVTAIASEWKTAGLAATPDAIPYNSVNLNELKTTVHGVFLGSNDLLPGPHFQSFTTAQLSTAANRFAGSNKGGYSNPVYDRLYDDFSTALDPNRRRSAVVELAKMGADEAIWMPFYYGSDIASVRKGVRGVGTVPAVQGATTWNIHLWDLD
jgi:peptide/nickel transport system substrate-binding protein